MSQQHKTELKKVKMDVDYGFGFVFNQEHTYGQNLVNYFMLLIKTENNAIDLDHAIYSHKHFLKLCEGAYNLEGNVNYEYEDWNNRNIAIVDDITWFGKYLNDKESISKLDFFKFFELEIPPPVIETFIFLTIAPGDSKTGGKRLPFTENNIDKFKHWLDKTFTGVAIGESYYVLECGKNESEPNLHAHMFYKYKSAGVGKNFTRDTKVSFRKEFPGFNVDWKRPGANGWYAKTFSSKAKEFETYKADKIAYFDNTKKGTHENFLDLEFCKHYKTEV